MALLVAGLMNLSVPQLLRVAIDEALVAGDTDALDQVLIGAILLFTLLALVTLSLIHI